MRFDSKAVILSILTLLGLGAVLYAGALLFLTFISPIIWAGLVSFIVWPLQKYFAGRFGYPTFWAGLICLVIFLGAVVLIVPLSARLVHELGVIINILNSESAMLELFSRIESSNLIRRFVGEDILVNIKSQLGQIAAIIRDFLVEFFTDFGKGAVSLSISFLFFMLFTFFILKDAPYFVEQISKGLRFLSGTKFEELWSALKESLRAALIGGIITATIQGSLAGIGYILAGAPYPLFFTILTIIAGTIPFTPPLVFTPLALYVMFVQDFTAGLILMIYCWTIVNGSDPIIRPILVGRGIKIPTVLMFIGVLGGVANFGFLGIFIGPVIMAILRVFWMELIHQENGIS